MRLLWFGNYAFWKWKVGSLDPRSLGMRWWSSCIPWSPPMPRSAYFCFAIFFVNSYSPKVHFPIDEQSGLVCCFIQTTSHSSKLMVESLQNNLLSGPVMWNLGKWYVYTKEKYAKLFQIFKGFGQQVVSPWLFCACWDWYAGICRGQAIFGESYQFSGGSTDGFAGGHFQR